MDTTKKNILMCEKAVEIQEKWDFTTAFNILYDKKLNMSFLNVTLHVWGVKKDKERYVWLPSQHQLQGMVKRPTPYFMLRMIFDKCFPGGYEPDRYYKEFESMEQLWLAFVMLEKYQKIWDDKNWVKK